MISRANFTNCENFERFHEVNGSKSKAKPNYRWRAPPFVEPKLNNENILIIFTTENDSPNLARGLLMAFGDLEKRKHKIFARAPTLSKNPREFSKTNFLYKVNHSQILLHSTLEIL